jgi:hypothetical protein
VERLLQDERVPGKADKFKLIADLRAQTRASAHLEGKGLFPKVTNDEDMVAAPPHDVN